jgi:hypothetical protein
MNTAPAVLFVYKRPDLTKQTIDSLAKNYHASETDLIIYSDGARYEEDEVKVYELRKLLKSVNGFKSLTIHESDSNKGLAASIIYGVTEELRKYDRVIVLEDDMVTSSYFLEYMNEGLAKYENEERVISIHGYVYPVKKQLPETFFLRGADCWGWATWRRGWDLFNSDSVWLLNELKKRKLEYEFDFNGTRNNIRMLENQIKGKVDSWAIRWHASAFLQNKLTLYPGRSLVRNIGLGEEATHSKNALKYDTIITDSKVKIDDISIEEDKYAKSIISDYFTKTDPNIINRLIKKIKYRIG